MAVDIKLKRSHTHSNIPTTSDLSEGEFAINTYDGKMYMRDGSSNIVTVGSHYTTDFESTTKTFYVTVATKTSSHVHHGNGSSNGYKINGVFSPYLKLIPGITYRFDQSDGSNSGHPFRFYLDENKNTSYTTGVTTNGNAGQSGAYTEIVVTHSTPPVLHYQCSAHGLMGWAAFVNTSNLTAFDTDDLSEGSNLYFTNARAQAVSINNVVEDTTPQLGGNLDLNSNNITGTGFIELTAGNTYDPAGGGGSDTSNNVGLALAGGGRIVFSQSGYIRNIITATPSSTIDIGQGNTNYISGTNIFAGSSGSVKLHHATNEKLSTVSTGVNVTGNLTLTSTDTGSSAAPVIELNRDSSSPADADYLGQIKFKGDDDGGSSHVYAKITGKIQDASAGTEDGLIEFANVRAGSTTITARLKSDKFQLLNSMDLEVAGNTTLTGTLNGHTIPGGSGTLALTSDISASGIGNVVEDTTPQLGGDLASNGNNITLGDSDEIRLGDGNDFKMFHNGNNTFLQDSGTGNTILATNSSVKISKNLGAENIAIFDADGAVELYHDNVKKFETTSTGIQTTGTLNINGAYTFPTADGNSAQVLTTNGSGVLSFASVGSLAGSGIQNISDDSSPQLGGNLDVVTHSIISTSNRDINITPNGSGKVVLDGLSYPTADGTANQVLTTDGSGTLTFADASGGGGSGENVSWSVTQSSHGLAVGDVIYNNGSAYVKAQANATGTLGLFVVSAVANTNTFTATFSGKITLSSLTAGQYYFVSTTSAGDFTATEPTSGYSNPILFALSTTEAVVLPFRPQDLTAGGAAGARTALDVFSKSETNAQISAFSIALG